MKVYAPPSRPSVPYEHFITAAADNRLTVVAIADSRLGPPGHVALEMQSHTGARGGGDRHTRALD